MLAMVISMFIYALLAQVMVFNTRFHNNHRGPFCDMMADMNVDGRDSGIRMKLNDIKVCLEYEFSTCGAFTVCIATLRRAICEHFKI